MTKNKRRKIVITVSSAIIALLAISVGGVVHAHNKHKKNKVLQLAQANTPIITGITKKNIITNA